MIRNRTGKMLRRVLCGSAASTKYPLCLRPGPRHANQTWHPSLWSRLSSDVEKPSAFSLCEAQLAAAGQFRRAEWSLNMMERHMERGRAPGEVFFLPKVPHYPAKEEELAFLWGLSPTAQFCLFLEKAWHLCHCQALKEKPSMHIWFSLRV